MMNFCEHCELRMKQRKVSKQKIKNVMEYGRCFIQRNGRLRYSDHDTTVIVECNHGHNCECIVITVIHNNREYHKFVPDANIKWEHKWVKLEKLEKLEKTV